MSCVCVCVCAFVLGKLPVLVGVCVCCFILDRDWITILNIERSSIVLEEVVVVVLKTRSDWRIFGNCIMGKFVSVVFTSSLIPTLFSVMGVYMHVQ